MPATIGASATGLVQLLHLFCRPKCHALLFDSRINSASVVATNLLQLVSVVAAKLLCVLRRPRFAGVQHPDTLLPLVLDCVKYLHRMIVGRVMGQAKPRTGAWQRLWSDIMAVWTAFTVVGASMCRLGTPRVPAAPFRNAVGFVPHV